MILSISSPERDIIKKTDDYVTKTPESSELLDFLYESNLYRIDLNEEVINAQIERHQDHIEGEVLGLKQKYMSGSYMIVPTSTWETKRENRSYASERLCHYCYYAYKVEMDENGKYITVRSEHVDDLSDLPEGYDYVTRDFIEEKYSYDKEVIEEFEQSTSMSRSI